MKKICQVIFFLGSLLFVSVAAVGAAEVSVSSKVTRVTVYPDSALLTREASLQVEPGVYQFVYSGIIPHMDAASLRVAGVGSAKVKIFGAQYKQEYLTEKPAARVKALEKEMSDLTDEKYKISEEREILLREREWLESLKLYSQHQLPQDLVTKVPAVKEMGDLLVFLDTNFKNNFTACHLLELKIREIDKKIEALKKELAAIEMPNKSQASVVVDAEVLKAGSLDLSLSYRVYGATWRPMYDARASFERSEVELVTYGVVRQSTGEDWDDVDVVLSTAKPSIGARMPEVLPWFLNFDRPRFSERSSGAVVMKSNFALAGSALPMAVRDGAQVVEEDQNVAQNVFAASEQKGISVVYKILRKATIKSDGSDVRLPVSTQNLAAEFRYAAFPRMSDYAYLAAAVKNSKDLQLPQGSVSVFLDEDFVGNSSIDNIRPNEAFDLFLGADENVKVKREQLEKKIDDVLMGNIPSPNRKITLKYKITLENYKNKKIHVEFFETMPVSQDERIKVRIEQVSVDPKNKDWKDKAGVWRWEFELNPQEKKEIFYTTTVECPRTMRIDGF